MKLMMKALGPLQ